MPSPSLPSHPAGKCVCSTMRSVIHRTSRSLRHCRSGKLRERSCAARSRENWPRARKARPSGRARPHPVLEELAAWIGRERDTGAQHLHFAIGPADGWSKSRASAPISCSPSAP